MVKFGSVKDLARKELSEFLVKYSGTKVIVWDEGLTGIHFRFIFFKKMFICYYNFDRWFIALLIMNFRTYGFDCQI